MTNIILLSICILTNESPVCYIEPIPSTKYIVGTNIYYDAYTVNHPTNYIRISNYGYKVGTNTIVVTRKSDFFKNYNEATNIFNSCQLPTLSETRYSVYDNLQSKINKISYTIREQLINSLTTK